MYPNDLDNTFLFECLHLQFNFSNIDVKKFNSNHAVQVFEEKIFTR